MNQIEFKIIFRAPKYPVIVVSSDRLYSSFNINQLADSCISSTPMRDKKIVQVIDTTGEEFWYSPEEYVLSPGFSFKKWTKKKIIETFNSSNNAKDLKKTYSIKSISSKRLDRIVKDICEMLRG